MKLYLLRHGNAESRSKTGRDFDRGLSEKGKQQLKEVAGYLSVLSNGGDKIEVLCSSAKRTRQSYSVISDIPSLSKAKYMEEIYLGNESQLLEILKTNQETTANVLLVGHNNAISDLASLIIDDELIFPTSGLVEITFPVIENWQQLGRGTGVVSNKNF